MRQSGIVAAGALFAMRHQRARLLEDHSNAKLLATGLSRIKALDLDPTETETNMVRFRVREMPAERLVERLRDRGVLVLAVGGDTIRAVTSLMESSGDIEEAVGVVEGLMEVT